MDYGVEEKWCIYSYGSPVRVQSLEFQVRYDGIGGFSRVLRSHGMCSLRSGEITGFSEAFTSPRVSTCHEIPHIVHSFQGNAAGLSSWVGPWARHGSGHGPILELSYGTGGYFSRFGWRRIRFEKRIRTSFFVFSAFVVPLWTEIPFELIECAPLGMIKHMQLTYGFDSLYSAPLAKRPFSKQMILLLPQDDSLVVSGHAIQNLQIPRRYACFSPNVWRGVSYCLCRSRRISPLLLLLIIRVGRIFNFEGMLSLHQNQRSVSVLPTHSNICQGGKPTQMRQLTVNFRFSWDSIPRCDIKHQRWEAARALLLPYRLPEQARISGGTVSVSDVLCTYSPFRDGIRKPSYLFISIFQEATQNTFLEKCVNMVTLIHKS